MPLVKTSCPALLPFLAITLWFLALIQPANAQELGSFSSCPAAPEIAAASTAYVLSNETGLNSRQASALVTSMFNQLTRSAPEFAIPSTIAAMKTIQQAVLDSASKNQTPTESLTHDQIAELTPEQAVLTPDGYRKMTKAVVQGAIQGSMSMGMGADGLRELITAITTSMVVDAAKQAAVTAIRKENGASSPSNALPMDNAENGKDVTALIVTTIVNVAMTAGYSATQISDAVNKAGDECTKMAKNIDQVLGVDAAGGAASSTAAAMASGTANQVANQVASQVATQVASQVATQVAKAVAAEVKYHVDTTIQGAAVDTPVGTLPPTQTLPSAPGSQIIPGGNAPPNIIVPKPVPTPTPTPTPAPTPTPPSPGGIR